jgi:hypothetical protein
VTRGCPSAPASPSVYSTVPGHERSKYIRGISVPSAGVQPLDSLQWRRFLETRHTEATHQVFIPSRELHQSIEAH